MCEGGQDPMSPADPTTLREGRELVIGTGSHWVGRGSNLLKLHPTVKPVQLVAEAMLDYEMMLTEQEIYLS